MYNMYVYIYLCKTASGLSPVRNHIAIALWISDLPKGPHTLVRYYKYSAAFKISVPRGRCRSVLPADVTVGRLIFSHSVCSSLVSALHSADLAQCMGPLRENAKHARMYCFFIRCRFSVQCITAPLECSFVFSTSPLQCIYRLDSPHLSLTMAYILGKF